MNVRDEPLNHDCSQAPDPLDPLTLTGVVAADRVLITGNDHLSVLFPLVYAAAVYKQPEVLAAFLAFVPKGAWIDTPYVGSLRWDYNVETVALEDKARRFEDCGVVEDPNPSRDVLRYLKEGDTALHLAVRLGSDEVVAVLLRAGATRDALNEAEQSPLDMAVAMNPPNPFLWKLLSSAQMFMFRPDKLQRFLTDWLAASWRPDHPFVRIDAAWNMDSGPPGHTARRYH